MRDPNDIIAEAAYPCVKLLANNDYQVTLTRMYKIISEEHRYQELCRLVTAIGRHNPTGLLEIQAHFNSVCENALGAVPAFTIAQLNKELNDVPQAILEHRPIPEQKKEINQAIAALTARLKDLEQQEALNK